MENDRRAGLREELGRLLRFHCGVDVLLAEEQLLPADAAGDEGGQDDDGHEDTDRRQDGDRVFGQTLCG